MEGTHYSSGFAPTAGNACGGKRARPNTDTIGLEHVGVKTDD
jgi:hypothetical protein